MSGKEIEKQKALAAIAETFRIAAIPRYYIIFPERRPWVKAYGGRK